MALGRANMLVLMTDQQRHDPLAATVFPAADTTTCPATGCLSPSI